MTCRIVRHQGLQGHGEVTMIYTHVLNRGPSSFRNPAGRIFLP